MVWPDSDTNEYEWALECLRAGKQPYPEVAVVAQLLELAEQVRKTEDLLEHLSDALAKEEKND